MTTTTPTSLRAIIAESRAKFGFDLMEARNLHRKLCYSKEPGAPFVAKLVEGIIGHCVAAERAMAELEALAASGDESVQTEVLSDDTNESRDFAEEAFNAKWLKEI